MLSTLGVAVAGGRGARLGLGVPKAMVTLGGMTLLHRTLATLAAVSDELAVAAPAGLALELPHRVRGARGDVAVRRVHDARENAGPLAGLVAAFAAMPFRRAIVLGVDFPLVRPEFLESLLDRLEPARAAAGAADVAPRMAVVPAPGGMLQPLIGAYSHAAGPVLRECFERGERAVSRAVLALDPLMLGVRELAMLPGGADNCFNVNTPADLAHAERRLAASRESA